ncbi:MULTISPECIES: hypothetical protein [Cupriavidus]
MTIDYIEKAQQDTLAELLTWVQQVVEGRGESISQMVVSVVLGCIPGVGQAIDAYNILRSLYQLIRDSDSADNWLELVLCLIALVPGFGDALKNVFRMLRNGKAMARILDSLPATVRGNIEKWFRELNWAAYTAELIANTNRILDGLIDLFSTRVARWVLDKQGLQRLVAQLKALKSKATQKITEAMDSLQAAHQHAMAQPIPNTTAHVPARAGAPSKAPPGASAPPPHKAPQAEARNRDLPANTGGTSAPRQGQASAQQRQSDKSKHDRKTLGVSGEHIADYFFVKRQRSRKKINVRGDLYEMHQPNGALVGGHQGIDHIWHGARLPMGYRISDTKGTGKARHKLETPKRAYEALRYGLDAYLGQEDESRLERAVNRPTVNDGRQLSHLWVARRIGKAGLVAGHGELLDKIKAWERVEFKLGSTIALEDGKTRKQLVRCPYDRSLITVVGPNHNLHDRLKGVTAPRCHKSAVSHQIGTEFVIPTDLLRE